MYTTGKFDIKKITNNFSSDFEFLAKQSQKNLHFPKMIMLEAAFFKKGVLTTFWPIIKIFCFSPILTKLSHIVVLMSTTI